MNGIAITSEQVMDILAKQWKKLANELEDINKDIKEEINNESEEK